MRLCAVTAGAREQFIVAYHKSVGSHSWGQGGEASQTLQAQQSNAIWLSQAEGVLKEVVSEEDLAGGHSCPCYCQQTVGSLLCTLIRQEACTSKRVP